MATKRQAIAQLAQEDLGLLAKLAEKGMKGEDARIQKRARRAIKILRTVQPSAINKKAG